MLCNVVASHMIYRINHSITESNSEFVKHYTSNVCSSLADLQRSSSFLTQSACGRYCNLCVTRTRVLLSSWRNFKIPSCIK